MISEEVLSEAFSEWRTIRSESSATGSAQILSETIGENNIVSIFVGLQPDADKPRAV
jgi:hypothetical protein